MSPSQLLIWDTFVVLYFRCAYSCFSQRSNCSYGVFSRQRHSERVLLIEILKILLISDRVEKQDLETVPGEVEGGISWPWVCLESLGCILPPAVRSPSPALWEPSSSRCSRAAPAPAACPSYTEWGNPQGNLCNKSSCNHGMGFPFRKRSWTIPPAALLPLLRPRKVRSRGEPSSFLMIGKDRKFPFPLGGSRSWAQAAPHGGELAFCSTEDVTRKLFVRENTLKRK